LNATVTAANVNEVTQLLDVLVNKPAVGGKPGLPREWGIEKQRERLKYRKDIVRECRENAKNFLTIQGFMETASYQYLKSHITQLEMSALQNGEPAQTSSLMIDNVTGYHLILNAAIHRLERSWSLI
jgi:hypothetical protein